MIISRDYPQEILDIIFYIRDSNGFMYLDDLINRELNDPLLRFILNNLQSNYYRLNQTFGEYFRNKGIDDEVYDRYKNMQLIEYILNPHSTDIGDFHGVRVITGWEGIDVSFLFTFELVGNKYKFIKTDMFVKSNFRNWKSDYLKLKVGFRESEFKEFVLLDSLITYLDPVYAPNNC